MSRRYSERGTRKAPDRVSVSVVQKRDKREKKKIEKTGRERVKRERKRLTGSTSRAPRRPVGEVQSEHKREIYDLFESRVDELEPYLDLGELSLSELNELNRLYIFLELDETSYPTITQLHELFEFRIEELEQKRILSPNEKNELNRLKKLIVDDPSNYDLSDLFQSRIEKFETKKEKKLSPNEKTELDRLRKIQELYYQRRLTENEQNMLLSYELDALHELRLHELEEQRLNEISYLTELTKEVAGPRRKRVMFAPTKEVRYLSIDPVTHTEQYYHEIMVKPMKEVEHYNEMHLMDIEKEIEEIKRENEEIKEKFATRRMSSRESDILLEENNNDLEILEDALKNDVAIIDFNLKRTYRREYGGPQGYYFAKIDRTPNPETQRINVKRRDTSILTPPHKPPPAPIDYRGRREEIPQPPPPTPPVGRRVSASRYRTLPVGHLQPPPPTPPVSKEDLLAERAERIISNMTKPTERTGILEKLFNSDYKCGNIYFDPNTFGNYPNYPNLKRKEHMPFELWKVLVSMIENFVTKELNELLKECSKWILDGIQPTGIDYKCSEKFDQFNNFLKCFQAGSGNINKLGSLTYPDEFNICSRIHLFVFFMNAARISESTQKRLFDGCDYSPAETKKRVSRILDIIIKGKLRDIPNDYINNMLQDIYGENKGGLTNLFYVLIWYHKDIYPNYREALEDRIPKLQNDYEIDDQILIVPPEELVEFKERRERRPGPSRRGSIAGPSRRGFTKAELRKKLEERRHER